MVFSAKIQNPKLDCFGFFVGYENGVFNKIKHFYKKIKLLKILIHNLKIV